MTPFKENTIKTNVSMFNVITWREQQWEKIYFTITVSIIFCIIQTQVTRDIRSLFRSDNYCRKTCYRRSSAAAISTRYFDLSRAIWPRGRVFLKYRDLLVMHVWNEKTILFTCIYLSSRPYGCEIDLFTLNNSSVTT